VTRPDLPDAPGNPAAGPAERAPAVAGGAAVAGGPGVARRIWGDRGGRLGLVMTGLSLLVAAAGLAGLTPYDAIAQDPADRLVGPSAEHWFGTDQFGRDVAARTFAGVEASLRVAIVAVALAGAIGSLVGVAAGFFRGLLDAVVGRVSDVLFAFPAVLLALAIVAALGHGWLTTAIAIAVVYTPIFVRVARGPTLTVRELDYVKAGRALGFSTPRLLLRHVLPGVGAPIAVQVALALSWAILTESGLSFLGLGTQPPEPSLGLMVSDARNLAAEAWWALAFPAAAIVFVVIGCNLLGDGLRSALDPRAEGAVRGGAAVSGR
jgi:peptide/nickel transport system permease protein